MDIHAAVSIDNFPYRQIFVLDKSRPKKLVKSQNLVENVVMCGKYSLTKFANFLIIVVRTEITTTFGLKSGSNLRA